jgi:hypothetical protein
MKTILCAALLAAIAAGCASQPQGGSIDRSAVDFVAAADLKWRRNQAGTNESVVLHGDPSKPGPCTVPVPAGGYVVHYANRIHYDGAKGEECIIQVWGMGPAISTPAEKK